jgi:signal transduction histidine kinase/ligand-binding sensor domain-containing protein
MLDLKARWESRGGLSPTLAMIVVLGLFVTRLVCLGGTGSAHHFEIWPLGETAGQQSPVTAIVQSRDGYLWLGTYHGLVRFDGVRSVVFDSSNTRGLQNGAITSLFEDSDGVLWIGHETGQLTRLAHGIFEPVWLGKGWPGGTVETITSDEENAVWVLNDSGVLLRVRDGKTARVPGGASPTRKAAIARSPNGKIWIVCGGQVATLERGQITTSPVGGNGSGAYYERVLPSRDGGLWLLGNQRLRKWRDGRWVAEFNGYPRSSGSATVLLESRSGMVLAGMLHDGLYLFTPSGESSHFSQTNGLSNDWVRTLCEDQEGNLWVGTAGGLDSLRPRKVQMLSAPDAFHGCSVLSFALTGTNSAWVGTEGAGLYRYQDGLWSALTELSGISNLFVWSVLETHSKDLFVGTWGGGIMRRKANGFESTADFKNINAPVVSLYESRHGELWIGTTTGLYRFEKGKQTWFAGKDRLEFPDVRAISESDNGTLWFGMSGGGLASLQGDTLKQFRKQNGLGSDFVICLFADSDGAIWAGTSDNGLIRFKNGTFCGIGQRQGLPSSVISHIVDDGAGHLWIGSHSGILRASKDDLNRCADGATASVHWLAYGKAEGLSSLMCAGGFQPGASRAADGTIWFPTSKGIAIVDPSNVSTNTCLPPVVIEEMLADGRSIDLHSMEGTNSQTSQPGDPPLLQIPPGTQKFELRYTGLSFVAADKVQFKYRLFGLEDAWTEAGTKRVAEYSYLRPGPYRFQVLACNNDGLWNERGAVLSFVVLPYLWQTLWFQALAGSSLAVALGAGVFWAVRRQERLKLERSERQHALERERARIARDIHDDLGASLTRITMLSQSVRSELDAQAAAAADVDQIYSTARELTRAMDEIVWAVNPKHDTLDSLVTYLGRFAQQFLSSAGIRCRLDLPVYLPTLALTSEVRHNVFLAFKEALHNTVKHASATEVRISLQVQPDDFVLVLADNGQGFNLNGEHPASSSSDAARSSTGNGLANMKKRLEEIGGRCEWNTAPGEGTRVKFVIKTHDS